MATTKQSAKKVEKKKTEKVVKKENTKKMEKVDTNKIMTGKVVSVKMQNTVVVAIERKVPHKIYKKLIKVTKRIKADTNGIDLLEGDNVVIEMTRPISKEKFFKVIKKGELK